MTDRLQAWGDTKIVNIASCIVSNESGQILLLQRHSDDLGGDRWGFPGGRTEPDEDAKDTALRELAEETGIQGQTADSLGIHRVQMPHGAVELRSYRVVVPNDVSIVLNPKEHLAYRWYDVPSIAQQPHILWGVPTILHDFGFLHELHNDPTLTDSSTVIRLA